MSTQIQIRRDTTANWENVNPVLADGEIGFDTTEQSFKVGNGVTPWSGLDYAVGGAVDIDLSDYIDKTKRNDVVEGTFQIVWDDSADQTYPFNGRIGYNGNESDPNSLDGSFLYVNGTRGTFSIGRDGDVELHGESEIQGIEDSQGKRPWITGFSYVQASDFLDEDGNSIVGGDVDLSGYLKSEDEYEIDFDATGATYDVVSWSFDDTDDGVNGDFKISWGKRRYDDINFIFRGHWLHSTTGLNLHCDSDNGESFQHFSKFGQVFSYASRDFQFLTPEVVLADEKGNSTDADAAVKLKRDGASVFKHAVQAADFLDADGNSIIGAGGDSNDPRITDQQITNWDVSFGWGDHKGLYVETESDPTVPQHVKDISQADINNWNNPPTGGGGDVDLTGYATETWVSANYQVKGNYLTSSSLNGYATETWVGQNYQSKGSYAASNHNHTGVYQPAGSYAAANHTHSQYLQTESDPTVPSYVKSISQADINKWNNPPSGGGDDPNAVKLTGDQTVMGVKKFLGGVTYFQNMFIEGVPAGGVGISGAARIEFSPGATTVYGSSNTLQVNASGTSITGSITCSGVITGTDCVASSDERLKDGIVTAPVGLIDDLHGREWEWRETGKKGSGVVAQELEKVLPHLVHEDEDGMKSVSYNGLVAYLIEEVKALKVEVENLRNG